MSIPLAEALQQVEIQPGRTYRCEVNGKWVELRVLTRRTTSADQPEQMLDPWVEFPPPTPQFRLRVKSGKLPPPDVPDMPKDEPES